MDRLKLIMTAIFISGTAVGWWVSRGDIQFPFPAGEPVGEKHVARKVSPVKPKGIRQGTLDEAEARKKQEFEYTFFETLADPAMEKYVGLKTGKGPSSRRETVIREADPPSVSLGGSTASNRSHPARKPLTAPPAEIIPKPLAVPAPVIKPKELSAGRKSYVVQVGSFQDSGEAEALKKRLQKKGYSSFLLASQVPGRGRNQYRVFLGKYSNYENARKAAGIILRLEGLQGVVVLMPR